MRRQTLGSGEVWALLGLLALVVILNVTTLGSDPWPFRTPPVDPSGPLGPIVDLAGERWDLGFVRTPAMLGGMLLVLAAAANLTRERWPAWEVFALAAVIAGLVLLPAVTLQVGLRDSTEPWFHVNDSTYQIDLAGELIRDGENPYGHDYRFSGLERFYSRDGSVAPQTRDQQVALEHFAYFPGTPITATAWGVMPTPFDDYRFFIALCTLAGLLAGLAFRGPLSWRLGLGILLAANPLAVRAAWFGTADAPSVLLTVLCFAALSRARYTWAAALLAGAILLKQFAIVALPFVALAIWLRDRDALKRPALAFGGVLLAGVVPFAIADAGALWDDTIAYGADTYRIVGYGLSALMLRAGIIDDRFDYYPFLPAAVLVLLPVTLWFLRGQYRAGTLWTAAAGFTAAVFVLLFIGRVFQISYLVWPLAGVAVTAVLAAWERGAPAREAPEAAD